jgi:hypothetical protein
VSAADLNEQIRDNLEHLKVAVGSDGRIPLINSTYFADLSGSSITGVAKTTANNNYTAGNNNYGSGAASRLAIPVGSDKWAT